MLGRKVLTENPVENLELDYENPLTDGLSHAIFVNDLHAVDLVTGARMAASAFGVEPGFSGRMNGSWEFTGSAGSKLVQAVDPFAHNGIISAYSRVINDSPTSQGQFFCADDHGETGGVRVFQFRTDSTGKLRVITFISSAVEQVIGTTALTSGKEYGAGFTADHNLASNQLRVFLDGANDGNAALTGAVDNDAASLGIGARQDTPITEEMTGAVGLVLIWGNRAEGLTDQEHAIIHENPWQILKPRRRLYIVPTAAAGATYTLTADAGSYTQTGTAATLAFNRALSASVGAYTQTGVAATLTRGRTLTADAGAYSYTGTAATLTYTPAGITYTLTAAAGSYSYSGVSATLAFNRALNGDVGTYSYAGTAATLTRSRTISADAGSYSYTGVNAALAFNRALVADPGAYVYSGTLANLSHVIPGQLGNAVIMTPRLEDRTMTPALKDKTMVFRR